MNQDMIALAAERLRALADETRIRIMLRLRETPCNVSELSDDLQVAQPSISKHLASLKQVGIVEVERIGNQSIYSIRDVSVFGVCDLICSGVRRHHEGISRAIGITASSAGATRKGRTKGGRRNVA